jgi:hypothetical protein
MSRILNKFKEMGMKTNKLKPLLRITICCFVSALWAKGQCSENVDRIGPTNISKTTPESLIIVGEELEDSQIEEIIKTNPDVKILNLSNNNITDKGLESISMLENVTFLNISGNSGITYEGIKKMLSSINETPIKKTL